MLHAVCGRKKVHYFKDTIPTVAYIVSIMAIEAFLRRGLERFSQLMKRSMALTTEQ